MPKQNIAVELLLDGVWTDLIINDEVFAEQTISIDRGDTQESAALRPSSIMLRLNNFSDKFRISNPNSPLYGKVGVNTNLRVSINGLVRGIGEITSWTCGQTRDFRATPRRGKAWTDIEANGIFWRINQWTDNVESTMIKGVRSFSTLAGAWPLEEDNSTTVLSNLLAGGSLGAIAGTLTLGDSAHPGGCESSLKMSTGGVAKFAFAISSNSGWQVSFAAQLPSLPASATYESIFNWYDSIGRLWVWKVNNANYGWDIFDSGGTLLTSLATSYSGHEPTNWIRFRMKVSVSAGTVTYEPAWYKEGDALPIGTSGTFASTSTGCLTTANITGLTYNNGAGYVSVFGLNNTTEDIFNAGVKNDFNGHVGETAADRYGRLFDDLGIAHFSNGTASLTVPMGAQPVDSLAEILQEIRDTEDGILFESKTQIAPVFNTRIFRYNQTPFQLDVTDMLTGLPTLPDEVTNDLPIHNIITATNRSGGSYTAEDSTSVMGSQPPPNGRGEYKQTINVNVQNPATDLAPLGHWYLKRGTVNLPAYPQVVVLASALSSSKLAQLEDTNFTVGSVIEILNYREYTIRLLIVGYKEVISTHTRTFIFTCVPDQQFVVAKYDGTVKADLKTCTLAATAGKLDTSLTFTITNDNESWGTTNTPYDIIISGERITVKTMGAISGTSGNHSQTATSVIRSCNQVFKSLPVNSEVHIYAPERWAL